MLAVIIIAEGLISAMECLCSAAAAAATTFISLELIVVELFSFGSNGSSDFGISADVLAIAASVAELDSETALHQ